MQPQTATPKGTIESLLDDIGFDAVWVGELSQSKIMQPDQKLYTLAFAANQLKTLL